MRKPVVAILFGVVLVVSSLHAVHGQEPKYGYVDVRKVLLESKTGKRNKAELEKFVKQRKDQLAKEEENLKTLRAAYQKEQLLLTDTQKQQRQKEFQEKLQAYEKMRAEAQKELQQKDGEVSRAAMTEVRAVIAQIAKEQNLDIVFEKNDQPVLFAKDGPDLTDTVIKRLDAKAGK